MELQRAIKEILWKNSFVSLPNLGSFSKSYEPAKLSPDGQKFNPPRQSVTFDRSRAFNDEAIEIFLKERHGLSESDAAETTQKFVLEVVRKLDSGDSVSFDGIGNLQKDIHGSIVFIPLENNLLASETFGLDTIELIQEKDITDKKAQGIETPKPAGAKIHHKSRSTRKFVLGLIAAVVIVGIFSSILFLLFPDLIFSKGKINQQIDKEMPIEIKSEAINPDSEENINPLVDDSSSVKPHDDHIVKSVEIKTDKKQALFYQEAKVQDTKTYYIISGSFLNIENAQKHYDQLASKGFKPDIIQGNGNYRVSMVKFTDRNRALNELERIRTQNPNESVWLLGL